MQRNIDTKHPSPPILCLTGPTAAGKTSIALELARNHGFEIISVDSALVYRGLDIGSGKPDNRTLAEIPHRLVNIRDPVEPYSAADFRYNAITATDEILQSGKQPLLVGGTMLYFKVLRDGLAQMPSANPKVRIKIMDLADREGWPAVHSRLKQIDPESAKRIHPNDPQRLMRALEVYESSGNTLTEHHRDQNAQQAELPDFMSNLIFIAIHPKQRSTLHDQIAERFQLMLEAGFVNEVKGLFDRDDLFRELPAMRSVGYRQVWDYLDGQYDHQTMVDKSIAATRQLAKRQLTWLRSWPDLHRIEAEIKPGSGNIVNTCLKVLQHAAITKGK